MNSVIWPIIILGVICLLSFGKVILEFVNEEKKKRGVLLIGLAIALGAFIVDVFFVQVPSPVIGRETDNSAVTISADEFAKIEYRISTSGGSNDDWIEYEGPFSMERSGIVYARATVLKFWKSEGFQDVYVAENGLVYLSEVEKPGDTIYSIEAEYIYKDSDSTAGKSGNHYVGYNLKKRDIKVIGTTLNEGEKEITDFTYSPKVLQEGKNDIEIQYNIASGISTSTHLIINADAPKMIKLDAKYNGGQVYLDTILDSSDFTVRGKYEDGTVEEITGFTMSQIEIKEGKNTIKIAKDGLETEVEITAIDKDKIVGTESEPNDEISTANDIDVNIKYSGTINKEDDVDYYKLQIYKKGKIVLNFSHPKMDDGGIFWVVSLLGEDDDTRVELSINGKEVENNSTAVRVMPGTYYVKVTDYNYSGEDYAMTVLFEEEDDSYEEEPNDVLTSQAMPIILNKEYTGNLTNGDDVDYYKFSITEKIKAWITFTHNKIGSDNVFWKVSLFDDSDGEILKFDSTGENAKITSDSIRLPAGNYYIRIEDYSWSGSDYKFCVYSQTESVITENEDNNDYDTATEIAIGTSVTGNIQSQDDVDFYRFELPETSSVKMNFAHEVFDNSNTFWKIELFSEESSGAITNNDGDRLQEIQGDSSANVSWQWSSLPAGTYYFKIQKYNYCNGDYTITITEF